MTQNPAEYATARINGLSNNLERIAKTTVPAEMAAGVVQAQGSVAVAAALMAIADEMRLAREARKA